MRKIICQCEQLGCPHHSFFRAASCARKATSSVKTPYGTFEMCTACAAKMRKYLKEEFPKAPAEMAEGYPEPDPEIRDEVEDESERSRR